MERNQQKLIKWGLLLLAMLSSAGIYQLHVLIRDRGWFETSVKFRIAEILAWSVLCIVLGGIGYILLAKADLFWTWIEKRHHGPGWLRWVGFSATAVIAVIYPVLMFGELSEYLRLDWTRQAVFAWLVVAAGVSMAVWWRKSWVEMLPFAAVALAVSYHLATYIPDVSNFPFALGWSETTRYYVASTFFDHRIYGIDLPLPFRDFTRYLMQSVPFLIEDSPLWLHRFWQAALRFTSTYFAGYLIARRYQLKGAGWVALFSMWAGLYFFQGPVFYNLMVIVLLVYWLVKPGSFWRTLAVVVGISVWAGLSRVNWFPMPGLMAASFYMLQKPLKGKDLKSIAAYFWQPLTWAAVGTGVGLAVQQGYALISGNPEEIYYASFTSYLLWERLLPNPSYRLGILPHVLLLTAPLLIYVGIAWVSWRKKWHFLRPLGLSAIIAVLFAGGLVVSTKIGGGTNLHNMDVYLVSLLLVAAEVFFGRAVDREGQPLKLGMPDWLKAAVFAVPIIFVISYSGGTIPERDMALAEQDLAILQEYVDQAVADGGEVLFISNRHLITFGLIENVDLVHEHEKLLLQEMAMSQNQEYLDDFGLELAEQRYALIIHDPLPRVVKDEATAALAAENNVVLEAISPLFECAYQEADRLLDRTLSILVPRDEVTCGLAEE